MSNPASPEDVLARVAEIEQCVYTHQGPSIRADATSTASLLAVDLAWLCATVRALVEDAKRLEQLAVVGTVERKAIWREAAAVCRHLATYHAHALRGAQDDDIAYARTTGFVRGSQECANALAQHARELFPDAPTGEAGYAAVPPAEEPPDER